MAKHSTAYIGLAGNLGNRGEYIKLALKRLTETVGLKVEDVSDLFNTTLLPQATQDKYLNAVVKITTTLTPQTLSQTLKNIESSFREEQREKWAPNKINLDLLLFGQEAIKLTDLTIPHPQMHLRSSVLKGLYQLAPDLRHPVIKESVGELATRLNGYDFISNNDLPQLVSIAGLIGVGKTSLARKLSSMFNCKLLLEPYDTNPFLPDVYAGKKELALDSQLYFLAGRKEQLNINTLKPGQLVITDYIFNKELIFARRLLDNQQLALYERIHDFIVPSISKPVLVIYLQDSPGKCLDRIHKRNRPYEQQVEIDFLENIGSDYDHMFSDWKNCPLIRLPASELNYSNHTGLKYLACLLECYIAKQKVN